MNVWVYTILRDEKDMIGYWLRHYAGFASKIIAYDDDSKDGTLDKLQACPIVEVRTWPHRHFLDDDMAKQVSESVYKEACGMADWVIWADVDEFFYAQDMLGVLCQASEEGYDAVRVEGWNMLNEGLPPDDGKTPLTDLISKGIRAEVHDKQVVFRPEVEMHWSTGRHKLQCDVKLTPDPRIKNLHYRFLGYAYTKARNKRNYSRCFDKRHAWSCAEGYEGEHSAIWAAQVLGKAIQVI